MHKVFPYFFLQLDDSVSDDESAVDTYLRQLGMSLQKALSMGPEAEGDGKQAPNMPRRRPREHLYRLSVVRAKPFFGYSPTEKRFVKIELYDPSTMRKAASLVQAGAVMGALFALFALALTCAALHNMQGEAFSRTSHTFRICCTSWSTTICTAWTSSTCPR